MTALAPAASDLERILEIVRDQIGRTDAILTPTTRANDIPAWDSVAMVNVLFAMEEAFGIEFSSSQMERADGIPTLAALLREAKQG